ncbi:hypothetical protein [Solwaraspora sp. WMMD792]|uniref:hypothetical protein n=1 Tax=Solwaraspora sp. WMMD792 TaxID=3016099 RepID=UPI002415ACD0|nr:hypothetical protein [Solwaraspora sp. WMMD792]MDG4771559.1 hypothetical protein [Solwaraspora sp. WMMD792]
MHDQPLRNQLTAVEAAVPLGSVLVSRGASPAEILRQRAALTEMINQGTDSILLRDLGKLPKRAAGRLM